MARASGARRRPRGARPQNLDVRRITDRRGNRIDMRRTRQNAQRGGPVFDSRGRMRGGLTITSRDGRQLTTVGDDG